MDIKSRTHYVFYACIFLIVSASILISCLNESKKADDDIGPYASLHDSTKYVGKTACKQCHSDKFDTYIHTGMGLSLDVSSRVKSSAEFSSHAVILDTIKNLHYFPHWKGDSLFITEFRLNGRDTVFKRTEHIAWIVGSGQHTNSHLLNFNGYIYQAPVTFYTQSRKWDLPPGFEGGFNSRFSRAIGLECMSCHNANPGFVEGSENKFTHIPDGIDCERCHGPGGSHVLKMLSGETVDIQKEIDYSIVNPAKLPINLQLDICQRCHIQGNAVLNDGKSFLDFKPGMALSDVMNIYMPLYKGDNESHIMASHAERMKMSKCFIVSVQEAEAFAKNQTSLMPYKNALTCVTCHDPHVSFKVTDMSLFNSKCINCHSGSLQRPEHSESKKGVACSASLELRSLENNNCVKCHMPKSGSIDIPHVITTDHWIRKPLDKNKVASIKEFAGLVCINNENDNSRSRGKAFISYFEKFSPNRAFLDSAKRYFNDGSPSDLKKNFHELIHLAFLKEDYNRVNRIAAEVGMTIADLKEVSYSNNDAWTAYRIGESYRQMGDLKNAHMYLQRACELAPYQLDFRNKLAGLQFDMGNLEDARQNYYFILKENPKYTSAYVSLGYLILVSENNVNEADKLYDAALSLDPDNIQAMINKAGIMIHRGQTHAARQMLKQVLFIESNNRTALTLMNKLR